MHNNFYQVKNNVTKSSVRHDIARLCTLTSFLQGPSTQGYAVSRARSEGWRHQFRGEARIVDLAATFPTRSKVTTSAGLRRRASRTSERRRKIHFAASPVSLSSFFSLFRLSTRILRCNVLLDCIVTRSISVAHLIYKDPRFETLFTFEFARTIHLVRNIRFALQNWMVIEYSMWILSTILCKSLKLYTYRIYVYINIFNQQVCEKTLRFLESK